MPKAVLATSGDATRARANDRAFLARADRVGDHEPRIIGDAVGIFKAEPKAGLQRHAGRVVGEIEYAHGATNAAWFTVNV